MATLRGTVKFSIPSLPNKTGLRVAHLSDLHLGKTAVPDHRWMLHTWRNVLRLADVDVFVVSGDLAHTPDDIDTFETILRMFEGEDLLVVPGNHDVLDPHNAPGFEARFGRFPRMERRKHVEFLLFDSFAGVPMHERAPDELERLTRGKCLKHGRVDASQFAAFQAPSEGVRVAVLHHHPEFPREEDDPEMLPLQARDTFLTWCVEQDVRAVLYGHIHRPRSIWDYRGVAMLRGSATTKVPATVRILDVGEDGRVDVIELGVSPH